MESVISYIIIPTNIFNQINCRWIILKWLLFGWTHLNKIFMVPNVDLKSEWGTKRCRNGACQNGGMSDWQHVTHAHGILHTWLTQSFTEVNVHAATCLVVINTRYDAGSTSPNTFNGTGGFYHLSSAVFKLLYFKFRWFPPSSSMSEMLL